MSIKEPADLRKKEDIVTVKVPIWLVLMASIIFALVFFVIGSIFRHYPSFGVI